MIEHERETYQRWLTSPGLVRSILERFFRAEQFTVDRGKLRFVGVGRGE